MNKRIARLSLLFTTAVMATACFIPRGISYGGGDPTADEISTKIAQAVYMSLTAESANKDIVLTQINKEIESTPVFAPSINSGNWIEGWLSSPTCQPPCWEGIIPGQTTLRDSMKIIAQIPGVEFEWLYLTPHVNSKTTFVRWKFDAFNGGQVVTGANTDVVSLIELYPSDEKEITIKKIIDTYGSPSSIVRGPCFGEFFSPVGCGYVLLYKEKGMVLDIKASSKHNKPISMTPDIQVTAINLSSPEDIKIFGDDYQIYDEVVWDGLRTYKFPKE